MSRPATPPVGDYQRWKASPDRRYTALGDPRLKAWLEDHGIAPGETYRVRLFDSFAIVYRYRRADDGRFVLKRNLEVARRLPKLVWRKR